MRQPSIPTWRRERLHASIGAMAAPGKSAPRTTELKSECKQEYKSLQSEVLGFLISSLWVLGEAAVQGITVSKAEVGSTPKGKRMWASRSDQQMGSHYWA